jgi:hypothetical protein
MHELQLALGRFVVAARLDSYLFLQVTAPAAAAAAGAAAASSDEYLDWFVFRATSHGHRSDRRRFGFATVEVKVTWSSLC